MDPLPRRPIRDDLKYLLSSVLIIIFDDKYNVYCIQNYWSDKEVICLNH